MPGIRVTLLDGTVHEITPRAEFISLAPTDGCRRRGRVVDMKYDASSGWLRIYEVYDAQFQLGPKQADPGEPERWSDEGHRGKIEVAGFTDWSHVQVF